MAKDPVCGMRVDEKSAAGKSEYKGKTYYFCSTGCKAAFDQDPEQYAERRRRGLARAPFTSPLPRSEHETSGPMEAVGRQGDVHAIG